MICIILWVWATYTLELNQEIKMLQEKIDSKSIEERIDNVVNLSLNIRISDLEDENASLKKKIFDQNQQIANLLTPYK